MWLGDIRLGDTIDFKFTTRRFSTGAPFALSGGVISAYVGNDVTQLTAGITLTADFDGVTGLNHVRVVASGANGYAAGTNVVLVITTGTVDSVSVVGEVVGSFSIEARSALMPATAGRTLVVDAAGLADANAVKVGPTGAGTAQTAGDIIGDTNDIQSRLPAALTGGKMESNIGSITAGVIAAASFAAGAFDAVWTVASRTLTAFDASFKTGYALSAAGVQAIWDALTAVLTTVGSIGKLLVDNINATISSRSTLTQAQILSDATPFPGANVDAAVSSRATPAQVNAEVVDALNVDTYAEPTGVPPATSTLQQKLSRLYMALRNGVTVTATDKTFLDDGGAGEWKKPLADDGVTYTESEGQAP